MTTQLALLLLVAAAGAAFVWRGWRVLAPVLRAPPVARTDHPAARAAFVVQDVGLHRRLLNKRWSGVLHALIFSGFLVLFTAIVQSFGSGLIPGFTLAPIGGNSWIALLQDIFAVLITIGIAMAAWQRLFWRPKRFAGSNSRDAWVIFALVMAVAGTMLLEFACHILATGQWTPWRPVSGAIARGLALAGMGPEGAAAAERVFYWAHILAVLAFLVYIPGSKHRHILTAIPNIYFRNTGPRGALPPPPADAPGVAEIGQFDWKDKLDLISCTECGRCQEACPAYAAGLPLSPKKVVMDLRDHMFARERGEEADLPLIGGVIAPETLWACTTCRACMDVCPVHIEPMTKIVEMRRSLVEEGAVEPMLQDALASLQRNGNSLGKPARQRAKWTKDLGFKIKDARKEPVDVLWFVGDYASYDPRVQRITLKVAEVLHAAGVDFGILYEGEQNSGNDVRRAGEEGLFETLARANIDLLDECDFRRIMTTDPHSLNALRQEYRLFGKDYEVIHYTQLLLELMEAGRLAPAEAEPQVVTYHDPCYLGRYNGGFDAPRALIRRAGHSLHEMGRCRENSFCCGAGGGRIWMDDAAMAERPSENRIKEALALGDARLFVVACPKDTVMYTAAVQALGVGDRIAVRDMIDLVRPDPGVAAA
ncbi:(Fe-S)-binding protein [Ruixingdingia sedimenti]|uniref:(Fe-S)-binding protein n=1 Tax=Ruixingdingia sedimenti TaxID=3073604 RepID=A0ABU1F5C7_9RHOB|nr:(Fe-S)-binding protein [Xinfangfangia sp. LG-4]MDR5651639.1 (Fe-S)-binding protein [Xinfangfangia sp. LG-4]